MFADCKFLQVCMETHCRCLQLACVSRISQHRCWWDTQNSRRLQRRNPIITPHRPCVLLEQNRWVHERTGWKSSMFGLVQKGGRSAGAGMGRACCGVTIAYDLWEFNWCKEGSGWNGATHAFLLHTQLGWALSYSDTWWSTGNWKHSKFGLTV